MLPGPKGKQPTDEELARRAQQGCAASFEELVRRYQAPLLQFLARRAAEDAEDLVQETFIRAYRYLHRYCPSRPFAAWLFTIGRRLSLNRQRRKRPAADSQMLQSIEDDTRQPAQAVADEESRLVLWDMADKLLTERQATVMWLYYVEEMTLGEIAQVTGSRRGAVKTMLFRARRRLIDSWQARQSRAPANDRPVLQKASASQPTGEPANG